MNKELRDKRKKLSKNYMDYYYEVVSYLSKQNLSRFAFYSLRDHAVIKISETEEKGNGPKDAFHRGHELYFQKKINALPKKGILEKIGGFVFSFFALFFFLALFVYLYRFAVKDTIFYSEGMYLYITPSNVSSMLIYGFLGALLSIFIRKNDKKTKYTAAAITAGLGIICIGIFIAIGAQNPSLLKINMIVMLITCLTMSGAGLALEILISKRKTNGK